jgi:NAD-dependent dihydropyrimidine dehydrogenase PreA subunit
VSDSAYIRLWHKLDGNFMTAPKDSLGNPQPSFIKHLKLVYSPEEAEVLSHMHRPLKFTSVAEVAGASGRPEAEVKGMLDRVHRRNGLLGMGDVYTLPLMPLLLNIHHFYPEMGPDDLEAARLYQDYFIEDKFHRYYEGTKKGTPIFRTIPVEKVIDVRQKVLPSEEAHDFIMNHAPDELVLAPCPCRTRTEKMGIRECAEEFPVASCIHMGMSALHFEMMGLGKRVTREEAVDYFDEMQDLGMVGQTDNALTGNSIICMCCGCCCSQLRGRTRWGNMNALLPANFVPVAGEECLACGICADRCFFGALSVDDAADLAVADPEKCIGCGVCALACPQETLKLTRLERATPFETMREMIKTFAAENKA